MKGAKVHVSQLRGLGGLGEGAYIGVGVYRGGGGGHVSEINKIVSKTAKKHY